jgi:histidine triad (HIT) family protein
MEKTIFQKIVDREIPAKFVYEDDRVFAILDIHPVNIGHTLVIPKQPWKNIYEIPSEDFEYLMHIVQKLAQKIKTGLNAEGVNIIMNNEFGQLMKDHAHIHIIPRRHDDGLADWPGSYVYTEGEKEEVTTKIMAG